MSAEEQTQADERTVALIAAIYIACKHIADAIYTADHVTRDVSEYPPSEAVSDARELLKTARHY